LTFSPLANPVRRQRLAVQRGVAGGTGQGKGAVLQQANFKRKQRDFNRSGVFGIAQQQVAQGQGQMVHGARGTYAVTQAAETTEVLHGGQSGGR